MSIILESFYHIYNQGNNKQVIYNERSDYLYFLKLVREIALTKCEILAFCLMPNHFHFLIFSNKESVNTFQLGSLRVTELGNAFRVISSKYAQYFNKKYSKTGSLFRPKTKMKLVETENDYPFICFNYIHQNPLKATLVTKMEDWEFSSFKDFCSFRNDTLLNESLAKELLDIDLDSFYKDSNKMIDFDTSKIFEKDLIV